MSHIQCPRCLGRDHIAGYGLAAGGIGAYTYCLCGQLLEYRRDLQGMDEEELVELIRAIDASTIYERFEGRLMTGADIGVPE